MSLTNKTAGFTLVELLVALVVAGIISLVIGSYMVENIQQNALANIRQDTLQETQLSLDLAANDIRLSANADDNNRWPDSYAPSGADPYSWASNGGTLVLATAAQNTSGVIQFIDAKNYITEKNNIIYFVNNGTLYKRTLAAPISGNAANTSCPVASSTPSCPADKQLIKNVTLFSVTYLDGQNLSVIPTEARSIELHLTVSKQVYKQQISADYKTRMVFRNE